MRTTTIYRSGLLTLVLFALGHFAGFVMAARAARVDPALADATRAMRAVRTRLLGFEPSLLDFREYFSASFSLLLLALAVTGFVAVSRAPNDTLVARRLAAVYAATTLALAALSLWFGVVQGVVMGLIAALIFSLAAWSRA
ncbi:MAG: hypothetical protein AB1762_05045 [Gemmatimonadota bacterium]